MTRNVQLWLPCPTDFVAALSLCAVCACSQSTAPVDIRETRAVVFGSVTDGHGAPVQNTVVAVRSYLQGCPSNATGVGGMSALTDASGRYRVEIPTGTAPALQCVAATSNPTSGAGVTVSGATVQFKDAGEMPYDSVRVDLHLP